MSSNCVRNDDNTITVTITVSGDDWKKAQSAVVKDAGKKMNLKGFRKGAIPAQVIRKALGNDYILSQAMNLVADKAFDQAVEEYEIEWLGTPNLEVSKLDKDEAVLVIKGDVPPKAKLGQYKGLGIVKDDTTVTDEEVDAAVSEILAKMAEDVVVEDENAVAENGEVANIDFEGKIDGEPFAGGSLKGYDLVLGSNTMIPGFEAGIEGMKVGDVKDVEVTFPEDYSSKELAGKPAVFTITLNELSNRVVPELTDEIAAGISEYPEANTADELKAEIRKNLEASKDEKAEEKMFLAILDAINENSELTVPDAMVEQEIDNMLKAFENNIAQAGLDVKTYLSAIGQSVEDLRANARQTAETRVKNAMLLRAVAEAENLEVTDEDINEELEALSQAYGMKADDLRKNISMSGLKKDLQLQNATDFLMDAQ